MITDLQRTARALVTNIRANLTVAVDDPRAFQNALTVYLERLRDIRGDLSLAPDGRSYWAPSRLADRLSAFRRCSTPDASVIAALATVALHDLGTTEEKDDDRSKK